LNENKRTYIERGNQYEVGARILVLMNTLDRIMKIGRQLGVKIEDSFAAAINCMSGKDRTGVMDAMAKALTTMQEIHGEIPRHTDLVNNKALQDEFKDYLVKYLLEGGGLEITEINTDAKGYKVQIEAMIYGMLPEIFQQVQGQSETTKG